MTTWASDSSIKYTTVFLLVVSFARYVVHCRTLHHLSLDNPPLPVKDAESVHVPSIDSRLVSRDLTKEPCVHF
jgi:hypothetical protein